MDWTPVICTTISVVCILTPMMFMLNCLYKQIKAWRLEMKTGFAEATAEMREYRDEMHKENKEHKENMQAQSQSFDEQVKSIDRKYEIIASLLERDRLPPRK